MIKKIFLQAALLLCSSVAMGQISTEIAIKNLEKWWGASTVYAQQTPFLEALQSKSNIDRRELSAPFLISNMGRYIILDESCKWSFDGNRFYFDGASQINVVDGGRSLREAYIVAVNRGLKLKGMTMPAKEFFSGVVYNFSGTIDDLLDFAKSVEPGVLMLSEGWQSDYGALDFNDTKAKDIIDQLHSLGFIVVLSVDSYVSPDSKYFRDFRDRGFLVCNEAGKPAIEEWKSGYSAVLNLEDSIVIDFMHAKLSDLKTAYGVDGFNVCEGEMISDFDYSMVKGACGCGINQNVQEITFPSGLNWQNLNNVVPTITNAGLISYPYTTFDMTQGATKCDEQLFLRALQAMVMMPVMQFAVNEYNALSDHSKAIADKMFSLRQEIVPYILELAQQAATNGEPIVRLMEYNYSGQGFWDCRDQFMLGTEYIVAPILSKDNKRIVRLPRGRWIDDKGKVFKGPLVMELNAGIDRLPYFKRK